VWTGCTADTRRIVGVTQVVNLHPKRDGADQRFVDGSVRLDHPTHIPDVSVRAHQAQRTHATANTRPVCQA
jgi:hypothetical protein